MRRREEQEGEEVMHSAVYLQHGETTGTERKEKQVPYSTRGMLT